MFSCLIDLIFYSFPDELGLFQMMSWTKAFYSSGLGVDKAEFD